MGRWRPSTSSRTWRGARQPQLSQTRNWSSVMFPPVTTTATRCPARSSLRRAAAASPAAPAGYGVREGPLPPGCLRPRRFARPTARPRLKRKRCRGGRIHSGRSFVLSVARRGQAKSSQSITTAGMRAGRGAPDERNRQVFSHTRKRRPGGRSGRRRKPLKDLGVPPWVLRSENAAAGKRLRVHL